MALSTPVRTPRQKVVVMVVVFLAYLFTAQLSSFLYRGFGTTPSVVLAPAGVSLAAFILEGYIVWPAIALGALVNGLLGGGPLLLTLASTLGNTIQPIIGLFILRGLGFNRLFFTPTDMFAIGVTILFTTMIVPSVNVLAISLNNVLYGTTYVGHWLSWWTGSALSALVMAPFLMRWIRRPVSPRKPLRYFEIALSSVLLLVSTYFLFSTIYTSVFGISLIYIQIISLFWLAFRGGVRFTTLGLLLMTAISLGGDLYGHYVLTNNTTLQERIFNTEVYDLLLAIFFFILVSIEEQRRNAQVELRSHAQKLEEALAKISLEDVAKNEFIALLGHELRNPLAALMSSVEVLKLADLPRAERNELLGIMDDRIRSMAHLLDDILDISRITQRKFVLKKSEVFMQDIVDRAITAVHPMMEKQQHEFTASHPDAAIILQADPTRIEQILINLLHNAAKYTPPGGRIDLSYEYENDMVIVRVRDTGIGIPQTMRERIFERFVQINPKLNRAGGVGIGLSLTKSLIELHGGTIEVKSDGAGKGSEFIVRLPASVRLDEAAEKFPEVLQFDYPDALAQDASNSSGLTILVVDDNEDAARSLGTLLHLNGHRTVLAHEGAQVVEAAEMYKPDAIILDIGLPDIDGYTVARELRAVGATSLLIALSGYGQDEDKRKAAEAGFDFHLTKPAGMNEIKPLLSQISLRSISHPAFRS
jgi:signal transduction histidine kinase/CheY-like chemotaxis protein